MNDLHYAWRVWVKSPGFTAVVLWTLALGIGANSALFSVVYAVLIKPLPYPEPSRLVQVQSSVTPPGRPTQTLAYWSFPRYEVLRDQNRLFAQVAACASHEMAVTGDGDAERLQAEVVSASYFPLLGLRPSLGRVLGTEDDVRGAPPVVLMSHGLWQRRFGGNPNILGRTLRADGVPLTIVGVLPPGFKGQSGSADLWAPIHLIPVLQRDPTRLDRPWVMWLQVLARLRPGLSLAQAQAGLPELEARVQRAFVAPAQAPADRWGIRLTPLQKALTDPSLRRSLWVLLGAVGFVLLIACVNVAHLLLARGVSRERELAVRLALGASRGQLVRQLLVEALVLATLAGTLALLLAGWGTRLLAAFQPVASYSLFSAHARLPDFGAVRLEGPVLAFNFLVALGCGLFFGLFPAWQAARQPPGAALRPSAERTILAGVGFRRARARDLLVAGETGLALVLLVGAGLMLRSFQRLTTTPIGFDPEDLLTFRLDAPAGTSPEASAQFFEQVLERVADLPGVASACLADATPLSGTYDRSVAVLKGGASEAGPAEAPVGIHQANADYLRTLRAPLLQGRWFTGQDRAGSKKVAVINQTAARRHWPHGSPIGKELDLSRALSPDFAAVEIIGVVGDLKYDDLAAEVSADIYLSYLQAGYPGYYVTLRTARSPSSVVGAARQAVAALDADVPLYDVMTMRQRIANSRSGLEFNALLLVLFALLALGLAATGLYGLLAHSVARRTREIGIRMALGAPARGVVGLIVWQGMRMVLLGGMTGLGMAFALTRFLRSLLYEVKAADPLTFVSVALVLAVVALLASYLPARRATQVDPNVALRTE